MFYDVVCQKLIDITMIGVLGSNEYINVEANVSAILQNDFHLISCEANHVLLNDVSVLFK